MTYRKWRNAFFVAFALTILDTTSGNFVSTSVNIKLRLRRWNR